eukprot:TRINITY_DN20660_c0_g1_i1.p1 TRINITY_DN20660_c0_g1~~TRINITY_DN20660_c0_g1_i1.p1  ORF type:complete len:619 (+),score=102.47 TRINITY_DN20660_c0_g1_i1:82-1938(+)
MASNRGGGGHMQQHARAAGRGAQRGGGWPSNNDGGAAWSGYVDSGNAWTGDSNEAWDGNWGQSNANVGGPPAGQGVVVRPPMHNGNETAPQVVGPRGGGGGGGRVKGRMPNRLEFGEVVDVFHRYCQDPNGYFMVDHGVSGIHHPSIGRTDGWTEARVNKAWDVHNYDSSNYNTWVEILWSHKLWYDRRGNKLNVQKLDMIRQRVPAEQVRKKNQQSEADEQPRLALFHVRWGGERHVDPVTEGAGGWGQIGSTPSDNYINGWEEMLFETLGPTYEIISAFIQGSEELAKIPAPLVRHLLRGQCVGGLYFMWPIMFQDGHEYPAYVNRDMEYELLVRMEAAGIPTRFPHPAHLYRIFASKEWTAQMCLHPLLQVPLTTTVSRQAIALDPMKAAQQALEALDNLSRTRAAWGIELQQPSKPAGNVNKGVAKLGYSWEAMDVQVWKNATDLSYSLDALSHQPGSLVDLVFVQEWVDFDVEMRHFIVEADLSKPETLKPKKIVYTVMKSVTDNCFREFDRFERAGALKQCFQLDDAALADAERQAQGLIIRWLSWLQAQCSELPPVVRFDILAKRTGPGQAKVMTGELTELGGCFLGWPQGPQVVFGAMVRSCLKDFASSA